MPSINDGNVTKRTSQYIDNLSFDETSGLPMVIVAETDGTSIFRGGIVPTVRKDATGTYTYYGLAAPGTATSGATWRIIRITDADFTILYADGNANFDNVWDNRSALVYS